MSESNDSGGNARDSAAEDDSEEDDALFREVLREVARASPRTPPIFLARGTRLGPYEIVDLLGRGGMGVVYRAIDTRLGREVALKVLRESVAGDERRRRFLREARSAAAINHPNVATIYEVGEADHHVYLAMELIEGVTLRMRIAAGTVGPEEGARIMREIALGVARAHAKGIVHRDLKPENVMVTTTGAVKVLDFGLAKSRAGSGATPLDSLAHRDTETRDGAVLGTPAYMAPEQAMGEAIDARADVFALGVVLYELVTGVRPGLLGSGPVIEDEGLDDIVRHCIAPSPGQRFADASELLAAFDARFSIPPPSWDPSRPTPGSVRDPQRSSVHELTPDVSMRTPGPPFPQVRRAPWAVVAIGLGALVALVLVARSRFGPASASGSPPVPPAISASAVVVVEGVAGYVERRLTAYALEDPVEGLAVASDGRSYAYVEGGALHVAAVDGTRHERVTLPSSEKSTPEEVQFFPDGRTLLVGRFRSEDNQTWVVSLDDHPPRRARDATQFSLSPDGKRLAFRQASELVVGPVTGGATTYIESVSEQGFLAIAWSPDGTRLAIARTVGDRDVGLVEVARADGSSRRTIATDVHYEVDLAAPTWTANDRVAFQDASADSVAIMEAELDTQDAVVGSPRRIWARPPAHLANLQYRNGRFFFLRIESQLDVYVGRLDARQRLERAPARFTMSDNHDRLVGWMPDGRVVFSSQLDGQSRMYVAALQGDRTPVLLSDRSMVGFAVADDGDVLAVRRSQEGTPSSIVARVNGAGQVRDLFPIDDVGVEINRGINTSCARCSSSHPVRCVVSKGEGSERAFATFDPATGARGKPFARLDVPNARRCSLSSDGSTLYLPDATGGGFRAVDVETGAVQAVKLAAPGATVQSIGAIPGSPDLLVAALDLDHHAFALARMSSDAQHIDPLWTSESVWVASPMVAPNGRDFAVTLRAIDTDVYMLTPADARDAR